MVAFGFRRTTRPAQSRQLARTSDGDTHVIDQPVITELYTMPIDQLGDKGLHVQQGWPPASLLIAEQVSD